MSQHPDSVTQVAERIGISGQIMPVTTMNEAGHSCRPCSSIYRNCLSIPIRRGLMATSHVTVCSCTTCSTAYPSFPIQGYI